MMPFKIEVLKPRPRQEELAGKANQGPDKRSLPGRPTKAPAREAGWEEYKVLAREAGREENKGPDKRSLPGRTKAPARGACREG